MRYDGEDIIIQPGENPGFPLVAVPYAKKQNILRGSQHPDNPTLCIFLVGVKDSRDDVSAIDDATMAEADGEWELLDRKGKFTGEPMRKVEPLRKKGFTAYEAAVALPGDIGGTGPAGSV